jgi:MSHA pilin protein MshD
MSIERSRGVTLIELIMFMVIAGVALAGFFAVFSTFVKGSADPQARKQVLAIAESLMDEVSLMPFTYCDPTDANAAIATNSTVGALGGCATLSESMGPEPGETRYGPTTQFNNVNDYDTFSMTPGTTSGIRDLTNTPVTGLGTYSASISVTQAGLGPASDGIPGDAIPAAAALRISITVTGGGASVTLEGYRTRYAPDTAP